MSLSLNSLTTAGEDPDTAEIFESFQIVRNDSLTSFSFNSLVGIGGSLLVNSNPALSSFNLDSLSRVGYDVDFISNPMLCRSLVDELIDGLFVGGDDDSYDNADC